MTVTIPLTQRQVEFLDDLAYASENYATALDLGVHVEGRKLFVPEIAFASLGTAVGMRADIASEGLDVDLGERSTILGLSRKLANAGVRKAAPLP